MSIKIERDLICMYLRNLKWLKISTIQSCGWSLCMHCQTILKYHGIWLLPYLYVQIYQQIYFSLFSFIFLKVIVCQNKQSSSYINPPTCMWHVWFVYLYVVSSNFSLKNCVLLTNKYFNSVVKYIRILAKFFL